MVKTPHTRHSKSTKEPVTIDLSPGEVSRTKAEAEQKPADAAAKLSQAPEAPKASEAKPEAVTAAEPSAPPRPEDKVAAKPAEAPKGPSAASQNFGRADKAPPPPSSSGSRSSFVPGAVAGGVVALLVAAGLSYSGLVPPQSAPLQDDNGAAVAGLQDELASLRAQVAALPAPDAAGLTKRVVLLEQRSDGFESEIETLRTDAAQPQTPLETPATPVFDADPLEQRLSVLEGDVRALREGGVDETAVEQRFVSIREEIGVIRDAQSASVTRLEALEQSLDQLTAKVDEVAESPATAVIIAASSLKAAIDRGTPFMTELETYASLNPDAPEIAGLRDMAATGVPTRAQIAAEAGAAANAMIAAARPVDPNASVFDRLASSAMGLVQMRPVGIVEGAGVPETAARIDAAVQAGDYARALSEADTLPQEAKTAGEAFIAKLKARAAADQLVDQALAVALKK